MNRQLLQSTDPHLVGAWIFDPQYGPQHQEWARDWGPRKHHGTASGLTPCPHGMTISYPSGLVDCGNSTDFDTVDAQTIIARVRIPESITDDYVYIYAKRRTASVFYLQVGRVQSYFRYWIAGGGCSGVGGATNPYAGQWITVACTWDAAITTRTLYINGANIVTTTTSGSFVVNTDRFTIGNSDSASHGFSGDISWLLMWNRCMGASEIAAIGADYPYRLLSPRRFVGVPTSSTYYGTTLFLGTGQLDPKGIRVALGSALLDGSATLTSDGIRVALGSAIIDGAGSIDAAGIRAALAAAALDGYGALDVNGIRVALGQALLDGQADVTPNGSIIVSASAIFNASADLQAAGRKVSITFTGDTINFLFERDIANFSFNRDIADFTFERDIVRFNTP